MNTTTLNMTTLDGGVIIKKETAPAPPSGGESGNTSNWKYFDTTKATVSEAQKPIIDIIFSIFKESYFGFTSIACNAPKLEDWEKKYVVAMATDFNLKIYHPEITITGIKTIEETIGGVEALEQAFGLTEITKEQFYTLE